MYFITVFLRATISGYVTLLLLLASSTKWYRLELGWKGIFPVTFSSVFLLHIWFVVTLNNRVLALSGSSKSFVCVQSTFLIGNSGFPAALIQPIDFKWSLASASRFDPYITTKWYGFILARHQGWWHPLIFIIILLLHYFLVGLLVHKVVILFSFTQLNLYSNKNTTCEHRERTKLSWQLS